MALLDGKYEIVTRQPLLSPEEEQTPHESIDAIAADGASVVIDWYNLPTAAEEEAFENFRKLLRSLKRAGFIALQDVVSRPGAHYVVWCRPSADCYPVREHSDISRILRYHGRAIYEAAVYIDREHQSRVYRLSFLAGNQAPVLLEPTPKPRRGFKRGRRLLLSATHGQERPAPQPAKPLSGWLYWSLRYLLLWLPFGLLSLVGVTLALQGLYHFSNDVSIPVPVLEGYHVNQASAALYHLGLAVEVEAISDEAHEAGTVLASVPDAGTALRPGRTVHLRYALPATQLTPTYVPELRGVQGEEAVRAALQQAGLELGRMARVAADIEQDTVIAQSRPAGQRLAAASSVDVLLSAGPLPVMTFLPDLRGLSAEDAYALARLSGIINPIQEELLPNTRYTPGTVIAQNIAPATPLPLEQASLRLSIAAGERSDTSSNISSSPRITAAEIFGRSAPNLIGMDAQEALQTARESGVRIQSVAELSNDGLPQGVVMQNPAPGAALVGDGLSITVNVLRQAIPMPAVRTELRAEPLRRLEYRWELPEPVLEQQAEVRAITRWNQITSLETQTVRGGDVIEGTWLTTYPGPVTFILSLNGTPFGDTITLRP